MQRNIWKALTAFFVGGILFVSGVISAKISYQKDGAVFAQIERLIKEEYYYEIEPERVLLLGLNGALDEYSRYLSKEEYGQETSVEAPSVEYRNTLANGSNSAYVYLPTFTKESQQQFAVAVQSYKASGQKNLLLDLRGNAGGDMAVFSKIAAYFCKDGRGRMKTAIAKTKKGEKVFYAEKSLYQEYFSQTERIGVLADEATASAAECLLGCMLDYGAIDYADLCLVYKDGAAAKTFGKGVVQTSYRLKDGGVLRLTTGKLYFPLSKRCIDGVGIRQTDGVKTILHGEQEILRAAKMLDFL